MHDRDGSKLFSFSNLIPPTPKVDKGSERTLLVASPCVGLIDALSQSLRRLVGKEIRVGSTRFKLRGFRRFEAKIPGDPFSEFTLISGTPIVVRIPKYRYEEYGSFANLEKVPLGPRVEKGQLREKEEIPRNKEGLL